MTIFGIANLSQTLGTKAKINHQSELQGGEGIAPLNCVYPLAEHLTVD
ncbi:MAG: hypothetical protein WCQ59_00650 [Candidatus Cloacimonadaceae bacterium]